MIEVENLIKKKNDLIENLKVKMCPEDIIVRRYVVLLMFKVLLKACINR